MYGRTSRFVAPLIVAASVLAACGTSGGTASGHNESSLAPKAELSAALRSLGDSQALTATLKLDSTAANLSKIGRALSRTGARTMPAAAAAALAADHLSIEVLAPDGTTINDLSKPANRKNAKLAVTLGNDSNSYASIRYIGGSLYLQADVKYFLDAAGKGSQYAALRERVAKAPAFVGDLVAGKWVSLSASTLQTIVGFLKAQFKGKLPSASMAGLVRELISTLRADLSVDRVSTGSTDHLAISANLHQLATDEYANLRPLFTTIRSALGAGGITTPDLSSIPDSAVHLDGYVHDGALQKLSIDLGQFDHTTKFSLPMELDLSKTGAAIDPPASSTPVTLSDLFRLVTAATSITSTGPTRAPVRSRAATSVMPAP